MPWVPLAPAGVLTMPTTSLNAEQAAIARKNERLILQRLHSAVQCRIADALGVSEARVSRWKSEGEIAKTADLLALLGLKIVPAEVRHYDEEAIAALLYGHRQWLESIKSPQQLEGEWE